MLSFVSFTHSMGYLELACIHQTKKEHIMLGREEIFLGQEIKMRERIKNLFRFYFCYQVQESLLTKEHVARDEI